LEKSILQGTTHMRTHVEVDPGVGLRGLDGVLPLIKEYAWAIDLQICVFPQEGPLNNPGTDELMVEALERGCLAVGAAPYTDSNPRGQIDRVFEMAREFDVDIDMHLDFGPPATTWTSSMCAGGPRSTNTVEGSPSAT
jgi:cytosine deaminase